MTTLTIRPSSFPDDDPFVRKLGEILKMTGLGWGPKNNNGRRTVIGTPARRNGCGANSKPKPARARKPVLIGYFRGFSGDGRRVNSLLDELRETYPSGTASYEDVFKTLLRQHPDANDPGRPGSIAKHAAGNVIIVLIRHGVLRHASRATDDPMLRF